MAHNFTRQKSAFGISTSFALLALLLGACGGSGNVNSRFIDDHPVALEDPDLPPPTLDPEVDPTPTPKPPLLWGTDFEVKAVVETEDRLYLGGGFTQVFLNTGPTVLLGADKTGKGSDLLPTATSLDKLPKVACEGCEASVLASIPDGSGGVYIGGRFTHVDGQARANVAHILATGRNDPDFTPPNVNGAVNALAISAQTLYLGGSFTQVGGTAREYLAALNISSGTLISGFQAHNFNDGKAVLALAISGQWLYAGGTFDGDLDGSYRRYLAAFDLASGTLITDFDPGTFDDNKGIYALAAASDRLYVGGTIASSGTRYLGALSLTTGMIVPGFSAPLLGGSVRSLAIANNRLYAGGYFSGIGGDTEYARLAAFDPNSGSLITTFNPPNPSSGGVQSLTVSGDRLFAAGDFKTINGTSKHDYLARFNLDTGEIADDFIPGIPYNASTLATLGDKIFVGGVFGGFARESRPGLVAINRNTGLLDPTFNISPDTVSTFAGTSINALHLEGDTLYVAFGQGLMTLKATSGEMLQSNLLMNTSHVETVLVHKGHLYVGGHSLNWENSGSERIIARLKLDTGNWDANFAQESIDNAGSIAALYAVEKHLYAGGMFTDVWGTSGFKNLVAIDLDAGAVLSDFKPQFDGPVSALVTSGQYLYVGGNFENIGNIIRRGLALFQLGDTLPQISSLDPIFTADAEISSLAIMGSTLYAGGRYNSGLPNSADEALVAFNLTDIDQAPVSLMKHASASVTMLSSQTSHLYVGGNFWTQGYQGHPVSGIFAIDPATGDYAGAP